MTDIAPRELLRLFAESEPDAHNAVSIPMAQNHNDKATLFAGSIFSAAILSGYESCRRFLAEKGLSGQLVCRSASIDFRAPVVSDGKAETVELSEPVQKPNGNTAIVAKAAVRNAEGAACANARFEFVLIGDPRNRHSETA